MSHAATIEGEVVAGVGPQNVCSTSLEGKEMCERNIGSRPLEKTLRQLGRLRSNKQAQSVTASVWERSKLMILAALVVVPFCLLMGLTESKASTIMVNSLTDDSASGDGICSLRKAINNANSPGSDTTGGDCQIGSGTDTINFTVGGIITLADPGTCYPVTNFMICVSLPAISNTAPGSLTIDGTDKGVTIDANQFEPLLVLHGATLTVNNLTFTDGNGQANGQSGAGAIGSYGTLNVNNSTFSSNRGTQGAILSQGALAVGSSTFVSNPVYAVTAGGPPAAFFNGNPPPQSITNSTIVGNGVALNISSPLTVTNSTIYGNTGAGGNAAISLAWYAGGILTISNSILASNSVGNCSQNGFPPSALVNGGYNISDDASCAFGSSIAANGQSIGDSVLDANIALDPIGNNGGPTQTMALESGSFAIDAIPSGVGNANCPGLDQRGFGRPAPGHTACSVGAYEFAAVAPGPQFGPVGAWVGLKNSDDQGTQFDLRAEVYRNASLVATGQTLCVTGITRNANSSTNVSIPISNTPVGFNSGDTLSVRILTRIGTNPNGSKCAGHNNAVGLRLYYDATSRESQVADTITRLPTDLFLHSNGNACTTSASTGVTNSFLDGNAPTASAAKCLDSASVNFSNGNPWVTINSWSMTVP